MGSSFTTILVCVIAIVIQAAIIVFFIRRNRNIRRELQENEASSLNAPTYEGLRKLAIQVTPEQLKLNIPQGTTVVYGVLMDWNLNESVMTLAAYITGAANLYLSTGEGINGGGKDPAVGESAVSFVMAAQEYLGRVLPVSATDLPPRECIRFYLITNKGLFAAQEQMIHFEDASSPWLPLFDEGSRVITGIRSSHNMPAA